LNLERRSRLLTRVDTIEKPIHIVGLGRFGGNLALIEHLAQKGHRLVLWESSSAASLEPSWQKLSNWHAQIEVHWSEPEPCLPQDDWIFITPAMPFQHQSLKSISSYYLSTELELSLSLAELHHIRIHAVVGSVGKSTCAALMGTALEVPVVGNIGLSLLPLLINEAPKEVILEVSSFQLHYLQPTQWQPSSYLLTPIRDHHSDWHGGLEAYQNCKLDWIQKWKDASVPGIILNQLEIDQTLFQSNPPKLIGQHNLHNLSAVWAWLIKLNRADEPALKRCMNFKGLPHRLELCFANDQLKSYNDSKATSPTAVIEALNAFEHVELLILHGNLKTISYDNLIQTLLKKCTTIWLIGGMKNLCDVSKYSKFKIYATLDHAFELGELPTHGVILFSPAAPSYGDYANYEHRGDHFKTLLNRYLLH